MTDPGLPRPVVPTDFYLAAIHDRLGELLDRLPERSPAERADGTVELTEPKRPAPAKKAGAGEKREPAGGRGSSRPARRKPARKTEEVAEDG